MRRGNGVAENITEWSWRGGCGEKIPADPEKQRNFRFLISLPKLCGFSRLGIHGNRERENGDGPAKWGP